MDGDGPGRSWTPGTRTVAPVAVCGWDGRRGVAARDGDPRCLDLGDLGGSAEATVDRCSGRAGLGGLGQHSLYQCRQLGIRSLDVRRQRRWRLRGVQEPGGDRAAAREDLLAGQGLVQHAPEPVDVDRRCALLATCRFRRPVLRGADSRAGLGQRGLVVEASDSEVADQPAVPQAQDVAGLDVAVDDACRVHGCQAGAGLAR